MFSGQSSQQKLSNVETLLLLKHDLDSLPPETTSPSVRKALEEIDLPDMSFLQIPVLKKKKAEKQRILLNFWTSVKANDVKTAYASLKKTILPSAFQNAIKACHFEQVHWNTKIKKVAGNSTF